jgi:RND superfamily putative drug exporter
VSVVGAASILLLLAVPTLSLKTGNGALRQFPKGEETRVGMEKAAALSSPGQSQPTQVLVSFRSGTASDPANRAAVRDVTARVKSDPLIARVQGVRTARNGRSALVFALPRTDGESPAAKAMVKRLRAQLPVVAGQRADVKVGGMTAAQQDLKDLVARSMWKIIVFVLGLSFLVLMALLRSVVIPLKAVLMNLLSVGAAYGVLVAVFQWGWADGFLGFQSPGYVDTLTPPLVLAVVFGLSMDYEVFLLSRIRERYELSGDTRRAVAEGLATSARTITSAALIMVAVFTVFIGTGVSSIKEIGLGNAVAIAVDATLVRLILVPAAMELLGAWNWWLPGPLARLLPRSSFERPPEPAAA